MTKQTIEVEGLPEGFEVNTISINAKENVSQCFNTVQAAIHLKKIQPSRMVNNDREHDIALMEGAMNKASDEYFKARPQLDSTHNLRIFQSGFARAWEVKETDIPKEKPKLSLSVDDCKSLLSTNDNYAAYHKVQEFIKDK